jgi:predicted GNAT family acetyltransferase
MDDVTDNPDQSRFELPVEGEVAVAYYQNVGGKVVLTHTEVPHQLSGQGIGSRLAKGVFDKLLERQVRVVAKCPFMSAYAARHPEYTGLLDG